MRYLVRDQDISLHVSWLARDIGLWFFAEAFGIGFGLLFSLVDAIANLSHVITRWLQIDNQAFAIR